MINYSEELQITYREKEYLLDILHSKETINEWLKRNFESDILPLKECTKTLSALGS